MVKVTEISEHFQLLPGGDEREFLGGSVRADETGLAAVFRAAIGAAAGSVCGAGGLPATAEPASALSQRILRARFCDSLRDHPGALRAHPGKEFSAGGFTAVLAASGKGVDADPRSVFAGDQPRQVGRVVAVLTGDLYRRGLQGKHLGLIVTDGSGGGDPDGVSAGPSSALLGTQDAEHPGKGAEARLRRDEGRSPGHLLGRELRPGRSCVPGFPITLAAGLWQCGPAVGARSAGTAVLLRFSSALMAQTA